jgi:hypothetical protein
MSLCTDSGAPGGRAASAILGCPTHGVVARYAITADATAPAGVTLGAEQRLIDAPQALCAQFGSNGVAHLLFDAAATTLYVSAGSGGDDNNVPDVGQLGGDPCGVGASIGGEFRAQLGQTFDGAVTAISGAGLFAPTVGTGGLSFTVVAKGLNDPWRMAFGPDAGALYVIDVGLGAVEELNRVNLTLPAVDTTSPSIATANNFGFPCSNGNGAVLSAFASLGPCPAAIAAGGAAFTAPRLFLNHPLQSAAFSALAFDGPRQRWLIGDEVRMMIFSVPANITQGLPDGTALSESMPMPGSRDAVNVGILVEAYPVWPSHIFMAPASDGPGSVTLLVDVAKGTIKSSDVWPNAFVVPSPSPAATSGAAAPALSLAAAVVALAALAASVM